MDEKALFERLDDIKKTLNEMLAIQKKPKSKAERFFDILGTGVAILGILTIIDVIKNWIGG
ncbi:MAG: hypothetical protein LBH44_08200 [Treponema sp.]|jgi:hypothetical protein|nr:hypothetical protein [Treponema sp.]